MKRYYFEIGSDEGCMPLSQHIETSKEFKTDIKLEEAEIEYNTDYFYCSFYSDCMLKEDLYCGSACKGYKPRNGKNGRCKESKNCYSGNGKFLTVTKEGKIIR